MKRILQDHIRSLKDSESGKFDFQDSLTFIILPALISSTLTYFKLLLDFDIISIIIGALSILVGLLFNVLVLIFDMVRKDRVNSIKNKVLEEVLANISFTILISVFGIISCALALIDSCIPRLIFNWTTYFLLGEFLVTFFMILKRMYALLDHEIKNAG